MKKIIKNSSNSFTAFIVLSFFGMFLYSWKMHGGAWVYGLYSEVDGNLALWLSAFMLKWSHPFLMSTVNPFQGMGSLYIPLNSWWNPGTFF